MKTYTESSIVKLNFTFYPDRCCFCGKPIIFSSMLCKSCRKTAKVIRGPSCPSCGRLKKDCKCGKKANFYTAIAAPFMYTGVVRRGISLWKFREFHKSVLFFAEMMAASIKKSFGDVQFDVVTFIPQTRAEAENRTYNQSQRLAEEVGRLLNVPVKPLLIKLYETERQHSLHLIERSGNVFGVFDVCNKKMTTNKKILLIDDIKTSGRTINECAKMLRLHGAESVYCAVIAVV